MAQVGKPIPRLEDARFLQGNGNYVDDIHLDRMLYAAVFRSAWPHGRVRRIHTETAAALPGVIGVFTQADFAGLLRPIRSRIASMPGFEKFLQLPIATDKVRYVGEPMAVAVATSPYLAEDAASLISAEVEELDAILDWKTARKSDILVHELAGTNFSRVDVGRGDAEAAFRTAYYVRRETFNVQRHTAVPLETRGLVADWDPAQERMTVFGITKVPFFNRTTLAEMLGLPESSLVMKVGDAGGGFGVRGEFYPEDFLIPCIARKLASPVKWVEDRREHFLSTNHSRQTTCDLDCLRSRRHHSGYSPRGYRRHRRLRARDRRYLADALRAISPRALQDSELRLQGECPRFEQDPPRGRIAGLAVSRPTSFASG